MNHCPANTQRRRNVAATSRRCNDVVTTLLRRCVFTVWGLKSVLFETSPLILMQLQTTHICGVRIRVLYLICEAQSESTKGIEVETRMQACEHIMQIVHSLMKRTLENSIEDVQGPVVQSIVSLKSSLEVKLLTVLVSMVSNLQVFLLKKCA